MITPKKNDIVFVEINKKTITVRLLSKKSDFWLAEDQKGHLHMVKFTKIKSQSTK